jgi:hypothetical protein
MLASTFVHSKRKIDNYAGHLPRSAQHELEPLASNILTRYWHVFHLVGPRAQTCFHQHQPSAPTTRPFRVCGTHFHPARRPQWTSSADSSLPALISKVSHYVQLCGGLVAHCLRRDWNSSPMFASLSNVAAALCAVLSEQLRSRQVVRSKSSATCSGFDGWAMAWR